MANDNLESADAECVVTFSSPYSCLEECQVTYDPNRGCFAFTATVRTDIYCPYTNDQLRKDLEASADDLATKYDAADVRIGDCFYEVKDWKIVAIMAVVFGLLGLILLLLIVRYILKPERKLSARKQKRQLSNALARRSTHEYKDRTMSQYTTGYYENQLEVLDEED